MDPEINFKKNPPVFQKPTINKLFHDKGVSQDVKNVDSSSNYLNY